MIASVFELAITVTWAAPFARSLPAPLASVTQTSTVRFVGSLERLNSVTCPCIASADVSVGTTVAMSPP